MNRALLLVAGWIGRGFSTWLCTLRRPLASELAALHERLDKLRAENDLLRARLRRLDPHARPRYKSWERLAILLHRTRYGMSVEATARAFVLSIPTILNWLKEVENGAARLVQARKPLNALPDLVREIALFLKSQWPCWGTRRIAGILARLGMKASRTSVQRLLRRSPPRRLAAARLPRPGRLPRPKAPRHVYAIDFTQLMGIFRSIIVGVVIDLFSRKVLALCVCSREPDATFACMLLARAIHDHGKPRWLLTDRGGQFVARRFSRFVRICPVNPMWLAA